MFVLKIRPPSLSCIAVAVWLLLGAARTDGKNSEVESCYYGGDLLALESNHGERLSSPQCYGTSFVLPVDVWETSKSCILWILLQICPITVFLRLSASGPHHTRQQSMSMAGTSLHTTLVTAPQSWHAGMTAKFDDIAEEVPLGGATILLCTVLMSVAWCAEVALREPVLETAAM